MPRGDKWYHVREVSEAFIVSPKHPFSDEHEYDNEDETEHNKKQDEE